MPDLKVPAAVADLYFDLRERRLLPLIAFVIVAIVAVPFLLGSDPEPVVPPPVTGDFAGDEAATTSFTVVEAKPGLRAPGKRLDARTPTDPFMQRYTGLPKEAQLESTSTSSSTSGGGEPTGELIVGEEEVVEETVPAPEEDGGAPSPRLELVIDVQISRTEKTADGGEESGELEVRRNVPVLTQLPGKKTPVVTAMGANLQKERLVFLVSHEVKAVIGEFSCITRGEICELLEVAPGMLLEYVYEPSGARYAIKVTDVRIVRARKRGGESSSRAALGGPVPRSALVVGQFQK